MSTAPEIGLPAQEAGTKRHTMDPDANTGKAIHHLRGRLRVKIQWPQKALVFQAVKLETFLLGHSHRPY